MTCFKSRYNELMLLAYLHGGDLGLWDWLKFLLVLAFAAGFILLIVIVVVQAFTKKD